MFSADCIWPEMYWKIENGKLMYTGTISTKSWFDSGYTSVEQAHKAGVREIFDLAQLQKIVEDKKCHTQ